MLKVSEDDWKEYTFPHVTCRILATISDGNPLGYHWFWVSMLYKKYRLGDWNNSIPDPASIPDKTYLMWHDEAYCLFHKEHKKFGNYIIEGAHPYAENVFVFFDFFSLKPSFDALNKGGATQVPYIPTYYAHPHDRHDFQTDQHLWE